VWFRSTHQVGLTVQGWGDGLLVAEEMPKSEQHPQGGQILVFTGYDADGFADVEKHWQL
jgi:hypothetical protein